jgi:hypothetical protein
MGYEFKINLIFLKKLFSILQYFINFYFIFFLIFGYRSDPVAKDHKMLLFSITAMKQGIPDTFLP